jgi:hypothetical protein
MYRDGSGRRAIVTHGGKEATPMAKKAKKAAKKKGK